MGSFETVLSITGGVVALIGVILALARHFWMIENKLEKVQAEAEKRELREKLEKVEGQLTQLRSSVAQAGKAGTIALNLKSRLDDRLVELMEALGASGGSVYIPVTGPGGTVHGLSFLSIEPYNQRNQALKARIIPLRSLAGRCFEMGQPLAIKNSSGDPNHYQAAQKIADYRPSSTLNLPLKADGRTIGVLQLLRKEGETPFEDSDVDQLDVLSRDLAPLLRDVLKNSESISTSSQSADPKGSVGTALFFDLSNSAIIFREFPSSFALQLLNEYFEQMCNIGFRHGGTLDNYMGDGALMRFNVPRNIPDHAQSAVRAASEMRQLFPEIRNDWIGINPALAAVQFRAGIATGPLIYAMVGHSMVQNLTVMGMPITIASALCDLGPRDRSVILISDDTASALGGTAAIKPFTIAPDSKASRVLATAYEVESVR